jgi:hypothetical protein
MVMLRFSEGQVLEIEVRGVSEVEVHRVSEIEVSRVSGG